MQRDLHAVVPREMKHFKVLAQHVLAKLRSIDPDSEWLTSRGSDPLAQVERQLQEFVDRELLTVSDGPRFGIREYRLKFQNFAPVLGQQDLVQEIRQWFDGPLLLSGAILHDVAKTWELEANNLGLVKGYTTEGELIGHLVKGAMYIDEKARDLGVAPEKAALLEHMLLSHHGQPEYGSPVRPMFLEAEILSQLDALDATIFEIHAATSKVEPGKFTDRQWALDNRKLFNHGRTTTEHKVNLGE